MPLAIDLNDLSSQTINSSTPDPVIDLTVGSNGTLILDGVAAQINSLVGVNALANTSIELINGATLTVNAALSNVAAGSTLNYDIGSGSQLSLVQPAVGVGLGNTTINLSNAGGTGALTFTPNLLNVTLGVPVITGLSAGDQINVTGATGAQLNGGLLTFTYPGALGVPTTATFAVADAPANASVVFNAATGAAVFACFLRGTRVATPAGEKAIEELKVGDEVLTLNRGRTAIKWIGRRELDPAAIHPATAALPVRVRAHAIAENIPHRDLYLSPDHSLLFHDVLIPVKLLLNGSTIVQERRTEPFEYLHIELAEHDVILVEGAYAETYLDMGNRRMFGRSEAQCSIEFGTADWSKYCYPPVYEGPLFEQVLLGLEEQRVRLGYSVTVALAS